MYLLMADTDVGYLWNAETNGSLVFGTGGAERARITSAGKFGIGTNAPSHQLEVVGPASVTVGVSAGGAGFAELELVGQAGKNYITSDDTLSFDIGGAERVTVATTGLNVTSGTLSQGGTAVSLSGHSHSGASFPTGVILPYIGYEAPTGWLFCNGATYTTSSYPDLANALAIAVGDESPGPTFSVPDLRDRFLGGYTSTGSGYSTSSGTFGPNNLAAVGAHTHTTNVGHSHADTFGVSSHASHTHSVDPASFTSGSASVAGAGASGSGISYATGGHTHAIDVPATTSGGPSATLSHTMTGSVTTLATTNVTSSSVGSVISPKSFLTSFIIKT
jgi:microcystin-dependent protein